LFLTPALYPSSLGLEPMEDASGFSPEEKAVLDFGRDLFSVLFSAEVRDRYAVSLDRAWHVEG
jgi:hypothetical protein